MDNLREKIKNLILRNTKLLDNEGLPPRNYPELASHIYNAELKNELEYFSRLLSSENINLKINLIERCIVRSTDLKHFSSFIQNPQSVTNRFLWDLTCLIVQPTTLAEALHVLAPSIKHVLILSDEIVPEKYNTKALFKQYIKSIINNPANQEISLLKYPMEILSQKPDLDGLNQFILSEKSVINLSCLQSFKIHQLVRVLNLLKQKERSIFYQLIRHNTSMLELKEDYNWYQNIAGTPRQTIEKLIQGLKIGGQHLSGGLFARESSFAALKNFCTFINKLPSSERKSIYELKGEHYSVDDVVNQHLIKNRSCVELAAEHLHSILLQNTNNPFLNQLLTFDKSRLIDLESKYGAAEFPLDIYKSSEFSLLHLPKDLLEKSIQSITPQSIEDIVDLHISFPSNLYQILWKHMIFSDIESVLKEMAQCIRLGYFNFEQKTSIAQAIYNKYGEFHGVASFLFFALETRDPDFFAHSLHLYPASKRIDALLSIDYQKLSVLELLCNRPAELNIVLNSLPANDLISLLITKTKTNGQTVLHQVYKKPNLVSMILNAIPKPQRMGVLSQVDLDENTVFHLAAQNIHTLQTILSKIEQNETLKKIYYLKNRNGETILHCAISNERCFKELFKILNINRNINILNIKNKDNNNILHLSTNNMHLLEFIINTLTDNELTVLSGSLNSDGRNLISLLALSPNLLASTLKRIPTDKRLQLLIEKDTVGFSALHRATFNPQSFKVILNSLPDNEQKILLGKKIILSIACHPDLLSILLEHLPENSRVELLFEKSAFDPIINLIINNQDSIDVLIKKLTNNELKNLLKHPYNILGRSVLIPNTFKKLLNIYPKSHWAVLLNQTDHHSNKIIHQTCKKLQLIKYLLTENPEYFAQITNERYVDLQLHMIKSAILNAVILHKTPYPIRQFQLNSRSIRTLNHQINQPNNPDKQIQSVICYLKKNLSNSSGKILQSQLNKYFELLDRLHNIKAQETGIQSSLEYLKKISSDGTDIEEQNNTSLSLD